MNSNIKTAIFWVVLICLAVLLWTIVRQGKHPTEEQIAFTDFIDQVKDKKIRDVNIAGNEVHGTYVGSADKGLRTLIPTNYPAIYDLLQQNGVKVEIKDTNSNPWFSMLVQASPFILLLAFWIFMMRQMQSGGNKALSFGKSRARLHSTQQKKVTFKDVAGVEEAKEELQEIIEFLREPQKFQKLGGRIPKGVLLIGPPGTGKTLLARAIAGEASVPFFSISGSDFVEMFVGVGASRVRDLFEQGKKNAPCIIFIDEIDAVGRHRGAGLGGGHDEREQTLNQLLVEMDGFESNEGVILVAATNRPDVLDPALLRPGRFDRRVVVGRPDVQGPRSHPARPHQEDSAGRQRRSLGARPRHTGSGRRRSGQPGQRSRAERRPPEPQGRHDDRFRARQGQDPDGRRAQVDDHERRRKAQHRLSRSRPRAGGGGAARMPTRCTRSPSSRAAWRWASPCSCPSTTSIPTTRNIC